MVRRQFSRIPSKHYYSVLGRPQLRSTNIPSSHSKSITKKGDLSDPNKWRGINLLGICSKIIRSIIGNRLGDHFIIHGDEDQCGSVKKGYLDANFTFNSTLQIIREHGINA